MNPNLTDQTETPGPALGSQLINLLQTFVVVAAVFLVIFLFIARPHKVDGPSMYPTFNTNPRTEDYIITDQLTYRFNNPKRGDVVVFQDPQNHSLDFIKRIIGLPSERIKVADGQVYINGKPLKEPYLQSGITTNGGAFLEDGQEVTVGSDEYFVMGDNRPRSSDSREWGFVKKNEILGRVVLRYWPPDKFGLMPGYFSTYNLN